MNTATAIANTQTVFPTETSVEAMDADLLHAGLTGTMEERAFHLRGIGVLLHAGFLQLILIVQQ